VFSRRLSALLSLSGGLVLALARPAGAASNLVQQKTVSGLHGRSGTVQRFAVNGVNSLTLSANDPDGRGGLCTETWVDYSTKPHRHFNPAVLVNCSGTTKTVAGVLSTSYSGISGIGVVVCEVPNTSGPIVRTSSNCKGQLSAMYLHSGKRYSSFQVTAVSFPDGVIVKRF
jgi:hypothetical protein